MCPGIWFLESLFSLFPHVIAFYMSDQLQAGWSSSFEYQICPLTGVAPLNARQLVGFHYDESYLVWLGFHSCL